ncbi:hypothetical protein BDK51DRAFT_27774, partial [Blyttiomyces helicus]
ATDERASRRKVEISLEQHRTASLRRAVAQWKRFSWLRMNSRLIAHAHRRAFLARVWEIWRAKCGTLASADSIASRTLLSRSFQAWRQRRQRAKKMQGTFVELKCRVQHSQLSRYFDAWRNKTTKMLFRLTRQFDHSILRLCWLSSNDGQRLLLYEVDLAHGGSRFTNKSFSDPDLPFLSHYSLSTKILNKHIRNLERQADIFRQRKAFKAWNLSVLLRIYRAEAARKGMRRALGTLMISFLYRFVTETLEGSQSHRRSFYHWARCFAAIRDHELAQEQIAASNTRTLGLAFSAWRRVSTSRRDAHRTAFHIRQHVEFKLKRHCVVAWMLARRRAVAMEDLAVAKRKSALLKSMWTAWSKKARIKAKQNQALSILADVVADARRRRILRAWSATASKLKSLHDRQRHIAAKRSIAKEEIVVAAWRLAMRYRDLQRR